MALLAWIRAHSTELIFIAFVINMTANADAIAAFYPISLFAFAGTCPLVDVCLRLAAFEFPRPAKMYWQIALAYCVLAIVTKFLFQISIFCLCNCASYHVQPYCERLATCATCGAADRCALDDDAPCSWPSLTSHK